MSTDDSLVGFLPHSDFISITFPSFPSGGSSTRVSWTPARQGPSSSPDLGTVISPNNTDRLFS